MQSREHAQAANADLIDTMSYTNVRLDDDQVSQVSTRGGARSDDLYGEVSSRLDRVTAALPDEIDVSRNNAAIGDTVNDEYAGEVPAAEAVKAMIHPEDRYPSPITSMDSLRDEARTRVPVARPVADVPLNGLAEHGVENGNPITVIPLAVDANAISGMSPTTNTVDSAIGEVTAGLSEIGAEDPGYKVATDPKYRAAVEDTVRAEADASRLRAEDMVAGNGIERGALIGSRSNAGGYMRDRDQGAYGVDDRSVESTYAEEVRSENPITPVTPDTAVDGESAALLDDEEYYDDNASEAGKCICCVGGGKSLIQYAAYEDPVTPPGESVVPESSAMASPLIQDSENLDPTSVANIRAPEDGAVASPLVQDSDNLEESPIAGGRDPAIEITDAVSVVPVESAASEYESLTATGDSSAATGAASASPVELTSRLEDSTLRSPASTSTLGGDPDEDIEGEDGEDGQGDYEGYESESEPLDSIYTEDPAKSVLSPRQSLTSPTKRSMGDVSLVASDEAYADSVISSKKPRFCEVQRYSMYSLGANTCLAPTGDYPPT